MEAMGRGSSGFRVYTTVSVSMFSMKRDLQWGPPLSVSAVMSPPSYISSPRSQLKVKPSAMAGRAVNAAVSTAKIAAVSKRMNFICSFLPICGIM